MLRINAAAANKEVGEEFKVQSCYLPFGIRVRGGSQHSMWKPRSQESQNNMLSCMAHTDTSIYMKGY